MRLQRALLLSGRLGKGHDTLAEACAQTLAGRGVESRTLDAIGLMGAGPGAAGDWVFRRLLSVGPVYDAFHLGVLRAGGRLAAAADGAAVRALYPRLAAAAAAFDPQVIVSVFATGAAGAARYAAAHPGVATVVFITDVTAHRLWVHAETDLFLVVSEASAATVRRYRPRARVSVVLAPVRAEFHRAPSRPAARAALGVPGGARCVLLMSGGWGLGPIEATARRLAARGTWVLAVAGANTGLHRRLQEAAAGCERILPFGYTDRVPELMAASDVVVTSPGDTCREARAVGRPLLLLDLVPGHGRENLMHELELGHAEVVGVDADAVADAVGAGMERGEPDPPPVGSLDQWDGELTAALASIGLEL